MRTHRIQQIALVLAAGLLVAGCETMVARVDCGGGRYNGYTTDEVFPQTPRLDCTFGDSVNTAIARQVADKDAGAKNAGKGAGMDGPAAKGTIDNYQKSFRTPEPVPSPFTIGVTGSGVTGGQTQ